MFGKNYARPYSPICSDIIVYVHKHLLDVTVLLLSIYVHIMLCKLGAGVRIAEDMIS